MATRAELDKWAREAVTLALYECLLGAASQLQNCVENVQGEACWIRPSDDSWLNWKAKRKIADDPKKMPPQA